jgi:hypothetical protein
MEATVQDIIRQGWSVDPAARGSFESILEALRRIRFKLTPKVDVDKVAEFVAFVEPSAAAKPAKEFPPSVKKGNLRFSDGSQTDKMFDIPDGIIAPALSSRLGELIAVVGLRGGSNVTGGLSAPGLASIAVRDWSDDFTFILGDHHYRCPSSVAQFLSPLVSKLHLIDATISELRLEVKDRDNFFGSVLEAARGGRIAVDSAHRPAFVAICAALWNSELYESVCGQLSDEITIENVLDRIRFLSATRCDISTELEFIVSHFYDFLRRPDALKALPFSMICEILGHGSLRLESEDSLYDFIKKGIETNREMFSLMEFVRWNYCSTDTMNDFFDLISEDFCEINASIWTSLCARLVLPNIIGKHFPPSLKKGKLRLQNGKEADEMYDIPDGIIAHLTRECGGNVHDRKVVDVTCGSFEKEIVGANPHSGACHNSPKWSAKNAADLEADSLFGSAYRERREDIPHTRNNWICYNFKERRIVPTHYTIRTNGDGPGWAHLKSWLVETSADGESWREVAREENNKQLNGSRFTCTFPVADDRECRFIRLVNIGRNHRGNDMLLISAWEIFGTLVE